MGCGCVSQHPGAPRRFLRSLSDTEFVKQLQPDEHKDKRLLLEYHHLCNDGRFEVQGSQLWSLVRQQGVPRRFRWLAWRELSGWFRIYRPGIYEKIAACEAPVDVEGKIAKDLDRTFPQSDEFDGEAKGKLRGILKAYATLYPQVGYIQGMNFIAGFLLMISETKAEDEAFFMFRQVMVKYTACLLYCDFLPLYELFKYQYQVLLKRLFADVHTHFQSHDVETEMYFTKWIFSIFTRDYPLPSAARMWDLIVCDGIQCVVVLALAVIKLLRPRLLQEESTDGLNDLLNFATDTPAGALVVRTALAFRLQAQLEQLRSQWATENPTLAEDLEQRSAELKVQGETPIEVPPRDRDRMERHISTRQNSPRISQASASLTAANPKLSPTPSSACTPRQEVAEQDDAAGACSLQPPQQIEEPEAEQQTLQQGALSQSSGGVATTGSEDFKGVVEMHELSHSEYASGRSAELFGRSDEAANGSTSTSPYSTSGTYGLGASGASFEAASFGSGRLTASGPMRPSGMPPHRRMHLRGGSSQQVGSQPSTSLPGADATDAGEMAAEAPPLHLRNLSRPPSTCSSARRTCDAKGIVSQERDSPPMSPNGDLHRESRTSSRGRESNIVNNSSSGGLQPPLPPAPARSRCSSSSDPLVERPSESAPAPAPASTSAGGVGERLLPDLKESFLESRPSPRSSMREFRDTGGAPRVVRSLSPARRGRPVELPPINLRGSPMRASSGDRRPRRFQSSERDNVPSPPQSSSSVPIKKPQRVLSAATCPDLEERRLSNEGVDSMDQQPTMASTMPSLGDRSHTPGSNWSQETLGQLLQQQQQQQQQQQLQQQQQQQQQQQLLLQQQLTQTLAAAAQLGHGHTDELRVGGSTTSDRSASWSTTRSAAAASHSDSPEAPSVPGPLEIGTLGSPVFKHQQHQQQQQLPTAFAAPPASPSAAGAALAGAATPAAAGEGTPSENRKRNAWESPGKVVAEPVPDDDL